MCVCVFFQKQIAGLQMREVRNMPDGTLDMTELRAKLRPTNPLDYESHTLLVCIENTLNYFGGVVLPLEWLDQVLKKFKKQTVHFFVLQIRQKQFSN